MGRRAPKSTSVSLVMAMARVEAAATLPRVWILLQEEIHAQIAHHHL